MRVGRRFSIETSRCDDRSHPLRYGPYQKRTHGGYQHEDGKDIEHRKIRIMSVLVGRSADGTKTASKGPKNVQNTEEGSVVLHSQVVPRQERVENERRTQSESVDRDEYHDGEVGLGKREYDH